MVRVGFPGGPRLAWYDRDPISSGAYYTANGVAPHALTKRLSYTVPTGKKAMLEVISAKLVRETAATAVGIAYTYISFIPAGGTTKRLLMAVVIVNTVGAMDREAGGGNIMLQPGDEAEGYSVDLSTGGAFTYVLTYKTTEFDA